MTIHINKDNMLEDLYRYIKERERYHNYLKASGTISQEYLDGFLQGLDQMYEHILIKYQQ
jgi:hypothetical protein